MTDATGRFWVTPTFSKRTHLLVKPVKEDQLWSSEAGMVLLFLVCFALLPSEAKRKWFSIEENLQLCFLPLSHDLLRTFQSGAGEVWKTNQKPHLDEVLGWHHRWRYFGEWSTDLFSNLTAELWTVKLIQNCFHYCHHHMCTMSMVAAAFTVGSVCEGRNKS